MKKIVSFSVSITIALIVLYFTIKLSGHKHSLGGLIIGLFLIDLIALTLGLILKWTKIIGKKAFLVLAGFIVMSLSFFYFYHISYDSYNETRSILGGINGE